MMSIKQFNRDVDRDMERLAKYSTSLEQYIRLLDGRDEIGGDVAKTMLISIESIDPQFDVAQTGMITLRALKAGLKEAARIAREMIRYVYETLSSLYVKFTGSTARVRKTQIGLTKRFSKLNSRATSGSITVSGLQRLSINGEFVGSELSNLSDIAAITDYVLNVYPKAVVGIARDSSRRMLNLVANNPGDDVAAKGAQEFATAMRQHFVRPKGAVAMSGREMGQEGLDRSTILPGNYAFVYTPPEEVVERCEANEDSQNAIRKALIMSFSELQLATMDRSEREIAVPPVMQLGKLLDAIAAILALTDKVKVGETSFVSVKHVVDDAIRQIAESNQATGKNDNQLIHMLGEISKKLQEPQGYYMHWLAVTLNIYLAFIGQCITHYENEGL
jgi:hypothetical protein